MHNRKFVVSPLTGALALAIAAPVLADPAGEAADARNLDKIEVHGEYVEKPSSVKYTQPLLDTPQTITVVTRDVMDQQNLIGLRDVLSTLPGITFGAGEGGGGYGDSITLRGFNANSDITTDGVRDSAQYTRTDNFNLDAVELINGANSVYSGAGSVGGNINLVSKVARSGDFTVLQAGAGTDSFGRLTVDSNTDLDNGTAVRVNAMVHQNDAPGRDRETFERWGFAPSVAFGLDEDTRFTASYFHQSDDNIPQYGVPFFSAFGGPLPGVDPSNYYGYHNVDRQKIDIDMVTGVFEHDFSENTTLRSLARYQQVEQLSIVNPPQGTWCLANGTNPAGGACSVTVNGALVRVPPDMYQPTGPRGNTRDTRNTIAISQTDLTTRFQTGSVRHSLVTGVSISQENFDLDTGNVLRTANGTIVPLPLMSLPNPDSTYLGPINYIRSSTSEGKLDNQALYVFDTLEFNDQWMLNLGARYEHNEGDTVSYTYNTTAGSPLLGRPTAVTVGENKDDLFSYRAGLVFKPVENASLYLSYSDSKTPSKASVNGTCTPVSSTTGATGTANCNVDPETAVNMEFGGKWDINNRLALTGAVFRNEREDYKVADPGNPDNPTGEQQLDGKARVDGVTLGAAGRLTHDWSIFANVTWLDSEVLQGVSDFCRAHPSTACANTPANPDPLKGLPITGTPERSGSLWTTYDLQQWTFGYGVTYMSNYDVYTGNGANIAEVKGFTTHRAMVGYDINERFALQLNVNNLFDKEYYTRIRNNGWATPGDARSVVLMATYRF
ncbi:TonB-dependent receptor [Lysobacter sp. MMG2]|uniref:TonB-dependent receptor n=1 Tax=Lysobacter sp. MMG2 TaxID=2801338 RepID=UPI001C22247D|nr:TonB-dependent receptor [Lysobacter sp. MMG2]MBU8976538.1 TonB-dependent receptor [Lysobacter sp. MMG2]